VNWSAELDVLSVEIDKRMELSSLENVIVKISRDSVVLLTMIFLD